MAVALTRYRFSVDEYHQMVEAGVFGEDDRIELIESSVECYESVQTYGLGDEVSLSAFDLTLRVSDVLLRSS